MFVELCWTLGTVDNKSDKNEMIALLMMMMMLLLQLFLSLLLPLLHLFQLTGDLISSAPVHRIHTKVPLHV